MRFLTSSLALFLSLLLVNASAVHSGPGSVTKRHARLSRSASPLEARADSGKRCPNRKGPKSNNSTTTPPANNNANNVNTPDNKPAPPPPAPAPVNGLIKVQSDACGPSGATPDITTITGPNGSLDWMNCGFEGGGWNPPHVEIKDIITQPLSSALQKPDSPFQACGAYIWLFQKYGDIYGIPPIMMASFAMQESGCNPNTVGGGGEQGLMQITSEKCVGAPGGNCKDPEFNIATATKFFSQTLSQVGGNVFMAVGKYNGWYPGLTKSKAFAAANSDCCRCQNNADYIHQFFNGWCQNVNAYNSAKRLGRYFNLDVCL